MSTKDYSSRQEKLMAVFLGWNTVPASGGAKHVAGDVVSDKFLGECKTHQIPMEGVTFKKKDWDKIEQEAMVLNRIPVLICDNGTQRISNTYCLLSSISETACDDFSLVDQAISYRTNLMIPCHVLSYISRCHFMPIVRTDWNGGSYIMSIETFKEYQDIA